MPVHTFNASPVTVHDAYISFSHPESLTPRTSQAPHAQELDAYSFGYRSGEPWSLTVSVYQLAGPTLRDDSAYNLRVQQPGRYRETVEHIKGKPVIVFADMQSYGFADVAFLLHGDKSADISLSADDPNALKELSETFSQVLQSWQWNG